MVICSKIPYCKSKGSLASAPQAVVPTTAQRAQKFPRKDTATVLIMAQRSEEHPFGRSLASAAPIRTSAPKGEGSHDDTAKRRAQLFFPGRHGDSSHDDTAKRRAQKFFPGRHSDGFTAAQ